MYASASQKVHRPPTGCYINWAHSLTRGLLLASLFNEGTGTRCSNLVTNKPDGFFSSGLSPLDWYAQSGGRWGRGINFNGDVSGDAVLWSTRIPVTSAVTVIALMRADNTDGQNTFIQSKWVAGTTNFTNNAWQFRAIATASLAYLMHFDTTNLNVQASNNSIVFGKDHVVAVTHDGTQSAATGVHIYVDGNEVSYATQTDGAGTTTAGASDFTTGGYSRALEGSFNGRIYSIFQWNRALEPWEVKAFTFDPFQFIVRVPYRRYFVPEAAAAGQPTMRRWGSIPNMPTGRPQITVGVR